MRSLGWLAALLGSAAFACSSSCVLDDDVRRFAGDSATDCGTADATHDRGRVDQCAADAFDAGKPFIARYERQGTDSRIVMVVASNTDAKVKIFRWDSAPCGGSGCDPATDVQACDGPTLNRQTSSDPNALPLDCASLGQPERICG